jgi:L-cysteine/cystine lyase
VPDLLHLERIRQEMPATTSQIYLNTGTFGPLPICAVTAMQQQMQQELHEGRLGTQTFEQIKATYASARQRVARLLNAYEDEIALTDNTGEGLNIICYGLNWQPGDEIITTNHEHFSLLAPLYQLRERYGVVIRVADIGPNADRLVVEAIADLVTERTRLVTCSHVTWTTGSRLDLSGVGLLCREHGIPVLIDGAQSAGAISIDIHTLDVDFYAIPGQKWLCGPDGTGALYARREALDSISSTYVGYWSADEAHGIEWKLQQNARRFEVGGRQTAAIAGQAAVLTWLEETVGYDWLFKRIADLHTYAYAALKNVPGLHILTPHAGASGLLTLTLDGQDVDKLVAYLRDQHNIATRTIPDINALRIATSFYNTEEEIDLLVKALAEYQ